MKAILFYAALWLGLLLLPASCRTLSQGAGHLTNYKDWKTVMAKVFPAELKIVCKEWPPEWQKCPDGKYEWTCIDSIDIQNDIKILDKLKQQYQISPGVSCKMAVIHQYVYGFNQWYCENFLIKIGDEWKGKEICRAGPNDTLEALLKETPDEKDIVMAEENIDTFLKLKSGTLAYNGDVKIITFLNENYDILNTHLVLYP